MQWNKCYVHPKTVQDAEILMLFSAVLELNFLPCVSREH